MAWDTAGHSVNIQSGWMFILHSPGKEANSHAAAFPVSPLYEAITGQAEAGAVMSSGIPGLDDLRVCQLPSSHAELTHMEGLLTSESLELTWSEVWWDLGSAMEKNKQEFRACSGDGGSWTRETRPAETSFLPRGQRARSARAARGAPGTPGVSPAAHSQVEVTPREGGRDCPAPAGGFLTPHWP